MTLTLFGKRQRVGGGFMCHLYSTRQRKACCFAAETQRILPIFLEPQASIATQSEFFSDSLT